MASKRRNRIKMEKWKQKQNSTSTPRKLTDKQQSKLGKFVNKEESKAAQKELRQQNQTAWKQSVSVDKEIGKRNYTEGQRNFVRALKVIENAIDKSAEEIKKVYGSDDIEELANQFYVAELEDYSQDELNEIEEEFNKTHGYQIRIKKATNPFAGIDFLGQY